MNPTLYQSPELPPRYARQPLPDAPVYEPVKPEPRWVRIAAVVMTGLALAGVVVSLYLLNL